MNHPMTWAVKSLTKKSLTQEYTEDAGDFVGVDTRTTTTTYRRR